MTKTEMILMGKRLASMFNRFGNKTDYFPYNTAAMADYFGNTATEELIRSFLLRCNEKYKVIKAYGSSYEVRTEALYNILEDMRTVFRKKYLK